jgi:hypothetical protein
MIQCSVGDNGAICKSISCHQCDSSPISIPQLIESSTSVTLEQIVFARVNMEPEDLGPIFRQRKSGSIKNGSSASSSSETTSSSSITQLPWKSPSGENLLEISMTGQTQFKQDIDDHACAQNDTNTNTFQEESSSSQMTNPRVRHIASFNAGGKQPPESTTRSKLLSGDLVKKDESRIKKIIVRAISSVFMVNTTYRASGGHIVLMHLALRI